MTYAFNQVTVLHFRPEHRLIFQKMFHNLYIFLTLLLNCLNLVFADGVLGCGGFVKSDVEINFSLVEVIND